MATTTPETHEFQAEIKQLLDIVVHSLYTEKEIFVRELVSNGSDALEKLRHLQLTEKKVFDADLPLQINIKTDEEANTITIQDYGIGMTREELVTSLGTIAHSGSKAFLEALKEGGEKNDNLIGQFGVGFYSVFMVAESVEVFSHSWKEDEPAYCWKSDGSGSFEIEEVTGERRGTKIVVKLKDDSKEYAKEDRIKQILNQYSAFVSFPIELNGERVNKIEALWLRNKSDITDEEYSEFYKFQSHAYDEPRFRLHFSTDAPLQINSLLFVPQSNPEKMGMMRAEPSVSLYCRKILIDEAPKDLLPEWLRFVKGVVDSEDLPLNISRETMQDKALIDKISKVLTKRFLKMLTSKAKSDADAYNSFYDEFGVFLKEGAALDFTHRDQLMDLLRFESSFSDAGTRTSLADYVSRMKDGQDEIYFLLGAKRGSIESGPYLEGFKSRNIEVLFCYEPVDEYVMNNVGTYKEKKLVSADQSDVKLGEAEKPEGEAKLDEGALEDLTKWLKETYGDKVEEVKVSDRLVNSPVLAANADPMMSAQMRRMMQAMNQDGDPMPVKVKLEINPRHAVIERLVEVKAESPEKAELVAGQLLDSALISAGLLDDPAEMVSRLYKLLEKV